MRFFLITVGQHTGFIWFRDTGDFIAGMNYIAVMAANSNIKILAFVLMSNHLHIVVACDSPEVAFKFTMGFKKLYSMFMRKKYGDKKFLRRVAIDIRELETDCESVERAIAYVQMNPVAANICQTSALYPWGTGDTFFNSKLKGGRILGEMSARQKTALLRSRQTLPADYVVDEDGFIRPESYVDIGLTEYIFRSPKRYNFFLMNSSKVRDKLGDRPSTVPIFSDQSILKAAEDLSRSMYGARCTKALTADQLSNVLRQLRRRFSSNAEQLARVTRLDARAIADMLEAFR